MRRKNIVLSAICAALVLVGFGAQAGGPERELPDWAFAQRAEVSHLPNVQKRLATTTPEQATESVGIKQLIKPPAPPGVPVSAAIRAAVMKPVAEDAARVVVDLTSRTVYVRRGAVQTMLPIEIRAPGASARAIAEVAQAGTADPWLAPHSVVVDGETVGLRMNDGESLIDSAVLVPELRQQTRWARRVPTVLAVR